MMQVLRAVAVLGAAILVFVGARPCGAQAVWAWPRITAVTPGGAQRGQTVDLTISGLNVGLATGLLFEGAGITVESVEAEKPAPPPPPKEGEKPPEPTRNSMGKLTARVRIAADAEPGARAVRVLTTVGPSDIAWFVVGQWPEVAEREPNNTREQAQPVALPATVVGQSNPAEDVDVFRFQARSGQTLVFDVFAARLESPLDSILSIQDATGRELALNEDFNGLDALLAFTFPATGDYFLVLRDLRHQGGTNHTYRLTMGAIPYVTAAFPPGGRLGATVEMTLSGFNLDGARTARATLPADAPPGPIPMTLSLPTGVSAGVTAAVDELPDANEAEPNDDPAKAQVLTVPGSVNGRISSPPVAQAVQPANAVSPAGQPANAVSPTPQPAPTANAAGATPSGPTDVDCFRFSAEKGQKLILEVMARRYGSQLDALLTVTNASGKEVAANDDGTGKDSRLEFTAPETGEYVAQITDLHNRQGPGYTYRFSIRLPGGDFRLSFTPDRLAVGPGQRVPLSVTAERLDGFDGEIAVELAGLPEGVSVVGPARVRAGQREAMLVLTAAPGAAAQMTAFQVTGAATIAGTTVRRKAQGMEEVVRGNQKSTRPVRLLTAAVTQPPDLDVTATPDRVSLIQGQSAEIAVTVERKNGFKGKVPLTVLGLPQGISVTAPDIAEDKSEGKITLKAEDRTVPVETEIVVIARGAIDNQRYVPHAAPSLVLTLTRAEKKPAEK